MPTRLELSQLCWAVEPYNIMYMVHSMWYFFAKNFNPLEMQFFAALYPFLLISFAITLVPHKNLGHIYF